MDNSATLSIDAREKRIAAIDAFVRMVADKTGRTPDALLEEIRQPIKDMHFAFTITDAPLDEFTALALAAFGKDMVVLDAAQSKIRIDEIYFFAVENAIKALKAPHLAPASPVLVTDNSDNQALSPPSPQQVNGITNLVLALSDATAVVPSQLDTVMPFDDLSRWSFIRIRKPAFKADVVKAVAAYLEESKNDDQTPEIRIEGNIIHLNGPATNAIKWVSEHLPPEIIYTPKCQVFDELRALLTTDPGRAAFFDYVSDVGSKAVTEIETSGGPQFGAGMGNNPSNFNFTINTFNTGNPSFPPQEDMGMGPVERERIIGVEAHKTLPRIYIETVKKIDAAVRAIDIVHDGQKKPPATYPVIALATKLDYVREELLAAQEDIAAKKLKHADFIPPPAVTEWLAKTIAAMDERIISDEIAIRKQQAIRAL